MGLKAPVGTKHSLFYSSALPELSRPQFVPVKSNLCNTVFPTVRGPTLSEHVPIPSPGIMVVLESSARGTIHCGPCRSAPTLCGGLTGLINHSGVLNGRSPRSG